jgi:uncharacterized protein (DUF2147 family)
MMKSFCSVVVALASLPSATLAADARGDWLVADRSAVIRVSSCGISLCGVIAWTREPGRDEHNPDRSKRDRSVVGVSILQGMKPSGAGRWDGTIYNPQNGKTYTGHLILKSADVLRIEGCVLGGIFCGGEDWRRSK